jgi:tetratricopeptide (TPR) repeat protein
LVRLTITAEPLARRLLATTNEMEGAEAKAAVTVTFSSDHSPSAETIARADALKEEGNKLLVGGKYGAAAGKYTEAIELRPSAIYLGNRAVAYLKLESYGLAIADSDDALALDPGYIKAYYRRASANMALGKYKIALRDFRQVIKLHPNDADARAKYKACDKAAKEAAFAAAIQQDEEEPLCVRCQLDDIGECGASPLFLPQGGLTFTTLSPSCG